jgi:CO dehydrogenase/acetyl-CoA synthase gamma subunit (corrinoid Fe-S protein)
MIDNDFFIRIYNMLPLQDCGECGLKTCKKFAEKIIIGEKSVFECTKMTNETAQEISLVLDEYMR